MRLIILISMLISSAFSADKLDLLDRQIDSLYQLDTINRATIIKYYDERKDGIDLVYNKYATNIMLKQYKKHFPEMVVNGDTTVNAMIDHSEGAWFPNLMRLNDESEICIIKSIFVQFYAERMNWNSFLTIYTYSRCADKIAEKFKYEYKK